MSNDDSPQLTEVKLERNPRKVTMGTSVDPEVAEILDTLAFDERRSPAAIIREAIHKYLEARGYTVPELED